MKSNWSVADREKLHAVLRMQRARMLLQDKVMTVSEAAFFIGYNDVSSFCTEFKKQFGFNPGRYRLNQHPAFEASPAPAL